MIEHELFATCNFPFYSGLITCDCTITFELHHMGYTVSREEPASGPDFSLLDVYIDEVDITVDFLSFDAGTQSMLDDKVFEYINSGRLQYDIDADAAGV